MAGQGPGTIVDEMAVASKAFREVYLPTAHIVALPFPVVPWDDSDGKPGILWEPHRIPDNLAMLYDYESEFGPLRCIDASFCRAPHPLIILISERSERGLLIIETTYPPRPDEADAEENWRVTVAVMAGPRQALFYYPLDFGKLRNSRVPENQSRVFMNNDQTFCFQYALALGLYKEQKFMDYNKKIIESYGQSALVVLKDKLRHWMVQRMLFILAQISKHASIREVTNYVSALSAQDYERLVLDAGNDLGEIRKTVITAFGLLCCKNIRQEVVEPIGPPIITRRRQKYIHHPRYRYHRLVLHGRTLSHGGAGSGDGEPLARHWVRGHFKHYTAEKPLLGQHVGTYWWSHHLAGRADRIVDKEYAIQPESRP